MSDKMTITQEDILPNLGRDMEKSDLEDDIDFNVNGKMFTIGYYWCHDTYYIEDENGRDVAEESSICCVLESFNRYLNEQ